MMERAWAGFNQIKTVLHFLWWDDISHPAFLYKNSANASIILSD